MKGSIFHKMQTSTCWIVCLVLLGVYLFVALRPGVWLRACLLYTSGVGRVGAVFQEDRLCPQLTPEENVALVLPAEQYKAKTQYKEQIKKDLIQLGLDDEALALPARKLSGGQKRRTALLRALWAESDTLLLDEPFTGMDPAAMKKAAAMLKARCGAKPALLATHDQAAIRELGWRVIELG